MSDRTGAFGTVPIRSRVALGAEKWGTSPNASATEKQDRRPSAAEKSAAPEQTADGSGGWWWALAGAVVFLLLYANHFGFAAWVGQTVNDGTSDIEAEDCLALVSAGGDERPEFVEVPCLAANARYTVLGDMSHDFGTLCSALPGGSSSEVIIRSVGGDLRCLKPVS
ncbi:hypothetical protein [Nocardiopsis flavescens]